MRATELTYFVSDIHLGTRGSSRDELEEKFTKFLSSIPAGHSRLFLVGDIFDFWYEYKYVIPSGHTRVLGALANLSDKGCEIVFLPGNHDIWCYSYFEHELGFKVVRNQPYTFCLNGKNFCVAHGDGVGKTSVGFSLLRSIFHSRLIQCLFSALHPTLAFSIGYKWAAHSRKKHIEQRKKRGEQYKFDKNSALFKFAERYSRTAAIDYFIFGHYHVIGNEETSSGSKILLMGEWSEGGDWLVFDGEKISRHLFAELI